MPSAYQVLTIDRAEREAEPADQASTTPPQEVKAEGDEDEKKEKVMVGMVCGKKDLYEKIDKHNRSTWSAELPTDLEEAAENEETERFALLVRNKKSYDSRKKLEIDSIVIQSPLLKNVLRDVLKDYPGVTTSLARLIFAAPFKPFVHRWEQLTAALEGDEAEDTKVHLKLLYDVLHAELKDVIAAAKDYAKHGVITYEHVWTIFQPGCIVYASRYGKPVAVRLIDGEFASHPKLGPCFRLRCDRVDWDGSKFGCEMSSFFISTFVGTMDITELECFPLAYHPDERAITASFIARGRLFEQLSGYHYKAYKGQGIEQARCGPSKVTVDCRIVIDTAAHLRANPNQQIYLKPLNQSVGAGAGAKAPVSISDSDGDYDDSGSWNDSPIASDDEGDVFAERRNRRQPLTKEQLLLCTCVVRGYALKSKKWLEFFVDGIGKISFNSRAFDSLVLPAGHKSLILAFAQSQVQSRGGAHAAEAAFDDVIAGKGRGVIMLLSGGPGIGKTLTAESVAETMRVPLYAMSAGDLGTSPRQVEYNLANALETVAKWGAVLLLDECDVFLEARSPHDLERNSVVSVFLRTLEYYEGILFLTTNRVREMDEAFHSRIHFSLEYPRLDEAARAAVWRGFLDRQAEGAGHEVRGEEAARLARLDINGRVIKNVLKTGNLLACSQGKKLAFEHLMTVLQVEGYKIPE